MTDSRTAGQQDTRTPGQRGTITEQQAVRQVSSVPRVPRCLGREEVQDLQDYPHGWHVWLWNSALFLSETSSFLFPAHLNLHPNLH